MKLTSNLILKISQRGHKEPASFRINETLFKYLKARAGKLRLSQSNYIEALILSEIASKNSDEDTFKMNFKKIKEYVC